MRPAREVQLAEERTESHIANQAMERVIGLKGHELA